MLVTVSVDRIELVSRLDLSRDLVMRGQVVWTGRSSMDICMQLFQVCRQGMMRKADCRKDSIADGPSAVCGSMSSSEKVTCCMNAFSWSDAFKRSSCRSETTSTPT